MYYIYSDEIHTGKTTKLLEWSKTKNNIAGILQPVIDNKRYLLDVKNNVLKCLEIDSFDLNDVLAIGKYKFSKQVFEWANKILINEINSENDWVIVDEVGPLELNGDGLNKAIQKIVSSRIDEKKIIFVVRKQLVEKFLLNYQIKRNEIKEFKFNSE